MVVHLYWCHSGEEAPRVLGEVVDTLLDANSLFVVRPARIKARELAAQELGREGEELDRGQTGAAAYGHEVGVENRIELIRVYSGGRKLIDAERLEIDAHRLGLGGSVLVIDAWHLNFRDVAGAQRV